jgi:hypothetical protein
MDYNGKLVIFTPFYKFQTISPYCQSLLLTGLVLKEMGINFDYWPGSSDFHVERTLNLALSNFARDETATDFLIIDADESWNAQDVVMILNHKEDIVCGVYKQTNSWDQYTCQLKTSEDGTPMGRLTSENSAILEANKISAGFMRIKKPVIQKYIETYPDDYFYVGEEKVYPFFWNQVYDHEFTGMDYAFSKKLLDLGYRLWVDPEIRIDHYGVHPFKGDFDKYLRGKKALNEVKEIAKEIDAKSLQSNG